MAERVLVTGARAPAALAIARGFRAAGLEVHLADSCPAFMARASRACAAAHAYASPRADPEGFARDVTQLARRLEPRLVVPTCEEIFHLAPVAAAQGFSDRLLSPAPEVLRRLHSKFEFAQACAALHIPSPETARVTSSEALAAATRRPVRCVVKREFSRFGLHALVAPGSEELARVRPTADEPWVVQRRVSGEEVSVYAVCVAGRLTAFAAYRSTWTVPGGAGYAFLALEGPLLATLRAHAATLASQVVRDGQFACDVIVDEAGEAWFIECNPRSTSGVCLFADPAAVAGAMLGRGGAYALVSACDVRLALWRYGLPEALRRGRVADWRGQLRAGRDVIGISGDRLPAAGAVLDALVFARRAWLNGQSLAAAMTADIEWNGRTS